MKTVVSSDSMDIPEEISKVIKARKRTRWQTQNIAKVKTDKGNRLMKSKKRKLKQLEDDKEKKQLLSKSVEILQKHKITEDVYRLLCSTQNIGQAETSKEKRRRTMQFSQAGLVAPFTDGRTKIKSFDDISNISETKDEAQVYEDGTNVLFVPKEAIHRDSRLLDSTLQPLYDDELEGNNISGTGCSFEEISEEHVQSNGLTIGSSCSMKKDSAAAAVDEVPKDKFGSSNHSIQGALSAPTVVHVSRPDEMESKRKDMPIVMMEQEIMEAINENTSVIICGETGCGKTTQVPQFLYEAGFGSKLCSMRSGIIGVTQPRRVAVLATAKRVAFELGLRLGKEVGFQVRHDKRIGENCAIKFMTDGILRQEIKGDFLLSRYSVIILDEVHERSKNTDFLIGMLSRVVKLRQDLYEEQQKMGLSGKTIDEPISPLKLILMSATLCAKDFTLSGRIFHEPPAVIEVPGREYPVTVHFSKRTEVVDYIGQAYNKVLSIHKNLPPGGILVFVTGQEEVEYLCSMLRKASKYLVQKSFSKSDGNEVSIDTNLNEIDGYDMNEINDALDVIESKEAGDEESDFSYHSDECESDLEFEAADDDDLAQVLGENGSLEALKAAFAALGGKDATTKPEPSQCEKKGGNDKFVVGPMCVFRLYGMLPAAEQLRVFGNVKEGERRVVVATNVAETSLTIPGIRYIVDTGREKVKEYNSSCGIESFKIQWISKASADQRKGRAGRTGPGHCYRLYSSAVFNDKFPQFSCPEISKTPVDDVVLQLKSMGNFIKVADFPFPTSPEAASLEEAYRCLKSLEALDEDGKLTSLGKTMSQYPMSPRHSRMLLTAMKLMNRNKHCVRIRSNLVLGYAVAAAAALSVSNPFIFQLQGDSDSQEQDEKPKEALKLSRAKFSNMKSDALTVAYALQCFEGSKNRSEFCANYTLHFKTMDEMSNLRMQLLQLVFLPTSLSDPQEEYSWSEGTLQDVEDAWKVPSENNPLSEIEEDLLMEAICAGWVDRVAKRISRSDHFPEVGKKVNAISYRACLVEERVYLHRGSLVSKSAPEFLVYTDLVLHTERPYIHGASSVKPEWLVRYAASQCIFSKPLPRPKPRYNNLTDQVYSHLLPCFKPHSWQLPYHEMPIKDDDRVSGFAYALLDGQVLPCLKSVRKFMAAKPSIILNPACEGERRVDDLLSKLKNGRSRRSIDNGATLRKAWKENRMELYEEIRCWFQAGFHCHFDELWENMHQEAEALFDGYTDKSKTTGRRKTKLDLAG